jgi:hypothetical protein
MISTSRRAEIEALLGPPTGRVPTPGIEAGPIPGDESGAGRGGEAQEHVDEADRAGMAAGGD